MTVEASVARHRGRSSARASHKKKVNNRSAWETFQKLAQRYVPYRSSSDNDASDSCVETWDLLLKTFV
jgi:hypothetical protein